MTDQQSSPGAGNPVVDLEPLKFEPPKDDGHEAVYRAEVSGGNTPEAPVFALTVTVASPGGDKQASADLKAFLQQMRAGFALTALIPDGDQPGDQNPEPFNIKTDILIEPELVRPSTDTLGVAVVVQTPIEGPTTPEGTLNKLAGSVRLTLAWVASRRVQKPSAWYTVRKGRRHYYKAKGSNMVAVVTCHHGTITMWPPQYGQIIPETKTGNRETAQEITVYGNKYSTYSVSANFRQV